MTAEIALLNRRALAFAADSAVTISDGKSEKIYNSAEKIFQLSFKTPMGLMMYNTMEFVGVPIDVLVRRFRVEKDSQFESCRQACDAFISYISNFSRTENDEAHHLYAIITGEFIEINKQYNAGSLDYFFNWVQQHPGEEVDFQKVTKEYVIKLIDEHIATHAGRPLGNYLSDITQQNFDERYGHVVDPAVRQCAKDVQADDDIYAKFRELAFIAVKSEIFSDGLTGIIVGGFGVREIFPSLYSIEIDGIFFDRVKSKLTYNVDIDRKGERAAIIPFAQSEMVERFLFGIDSSVEKILLQFVGETAKATESSLAASGIDISNLKINADDYTRSVDDLLGKLKAKSKKRNIGHG